MIEIHKIKKIPLNDLIKNKYNLNLSLEDEEKYLIQQQRNALFYQLELIRGYKKERIDEIIFIQAKNKSKKNELIHILKEGFICNGIKFKRFGKSASQAKNGITVFISEEYCDELINRSFLDTRPNKCVISKYESYRNLILSACEMINLPLPHIVIIDDYETIIPKQHVRTVSTKKAIFTTETNKKIKYNKKYIDKDIKDISILPFDGMGVHTEEMSRLWAKAIGLNYVPISYQIRLPFIKGMSTQAPIEEYFKQINITEIKDIFGHKHKISDIDCIWTKSMWKGYKYFVETYGKDRAWDIYINKINKYHFKLGFSKYSHRIENINLYSKLNFQYLQCLDFFNKKYLEWFSNHDKGRFDFSKDENKGKIIKLAEYSTNLFSKIINGDKLYTLKFLGLLSNNTNNANSNYIKAILINDVMLRDISIRKTLLRMLRKSINQLKYGKIYANGFYHVIVGDIKGFLEYAGGLKPEGCLNSKEIYNPDLELGDCVSMRSPLVDKSEINKVKSVKNNFTNKYLQYFKGSDVVMFSMKDISLPQQGGIDHLFSL